MLSEYLDIREVASLSVQGRMLQWKEYKSNSDIKELERKILNAVINNEIAAKKYFSYSFIVFLFTMFQFFPRDSRIRVKPADVTELYEKWGYYDMCFNPEKAQSDTAAPVFSKIPWIAPDNAFSELVYELWKKGYIGADSESDALKKAAPHFTVNPDSEILRKGLELKRLSGHSSADLLPQASEFEEGTDSFSSIKPARRRSIKSAQKPQKLKNKGDANIPE